MVLLTYVSPTFILFLVLLILRVEVAELWKYIQGINMKKKIYCQPPFLFQILFLLSTSDYSKHEAANLEVFSINISARTNIWFMFLSPVIRK